MSLQTKFPPKPFDMLREGVNAFISAIPFDQGGNMSNAETHALAMLGDLGPTVLPQLDNEAVRAYRRSYRMFRMGGSRGSSGEDPQV